MPNQAVQMKILPERRARAVTSPQGVRLGIVAAAGSAAARN